MVLEPNLKILRALAKFAAPNDKREYVRGVWLENGILTATDGTAFVAVYVGGPVMPPVMLPVYNIMALGSKGGALLIVNGKSCRLEASSGLTSRWENNPALVNMDWKRIIPASGGNIEPAQFASESIRKFSDLANVLPGCIRDGYHISHTGPRTAALVTFKGFPNAVGVLMPRYDINPHAPTVPDWAKR